MTHHTQNIGKGRFDAASESIMLAVYEQGVLPDHVTAADAVAGVMCVLAQRLSGGQAKELHQSLPETVQNLLRPCSEHQEEPDVFDQDEMLRRIGRHLTVGPDKAEEIAYVVFSAVKSTLSAKESNAVASQLPRNLADMWNSSHPETLKKFIPPSEIEPDFDSRLVIEQVANQKMLPPGLTVEDALSGVMCVLYQRLSGGEAAKTVESLPRKLQSMLHPCAIHSESPELFDFDGFIHRVANHLNTSMQLAEPIANLVFAAVKSQLTDKEIDNIASQLPKDMGEFWHASVLGRKEPSTRIPPESISENVLDEVRNRVVLPEHVSPSDALGAVMCVLAQGLETETSLEEAMPQTLRSILRTCTLHPETASARFDREGFVRKVSTHLNVEEQDTEEIIRQVFAALRTQVPEHDIQKVLERLPHDLAELWEARTTV